MKKTKIEDLKRIEISQFKKKKKREVIIILDNVRSLNNIGSCFRTSDAFLIKKIYLVGITGSPPNKDIDRTQIIFNTTPIVNSDDFYSARIMYKSSKIENINRVNKLAVIMLTGLIGIVISLLYVYILMSLRKTE